MQAACKMTTWLIALSFTAVNGTAERAFAPCFSFCRDPGAVAQSGCRLFLRESSFGGPPFPSAVMLILNRDPHRCQDRKAQPRTHGQSFFLGRAGIDGRGRKFQVFFDLQQAYNLHQALDILPSLGACHGFSLGLPCELSASRSSHECERASASSMVALQRRSVQSLSLFQKIHPPCCHSFPASPSAADPTAFCTWKHGKCL